MALATPRQRSGLSRPSYSNMNTNSSPSLSASAAVNRKASLQALTGQHGPKTPSARTNASYLEVGDLVNVPGEMYGTVKYIGDVHGRKGDYVGVELASEFAAKGKNSGDYNGEYYFNTTIPGAGIFLPIERAGKRLSPTFSNDSYPATPATPSHSTTNGQRIKPTTTYTPPTPAVPSKFSQSVGPGARPSSPQFKARRTSLPRPESPLRKVPPLAPPSTNGLSQSTRGSGIGRTLPTATPSKSNLRASTNARPVPNREPMSRPYSRSSSRLDNNETGSFVAGHSGRGSTSSTVPSYSQPLRPSSRLGSASGSDTEVLRLKAELAERDRRLAEQAANLADMELSVKELSTLLPPDGIRTPNGTEDHTSAQLRQILREKNEKITLLTSEFDQHRADFRSTLDSLEMASTETERVYEEQKRDLLAQVQELSERNADLEELSQSTKDFEDVARQLKGLEDFVQELEEGLEDARRGEAEARGEVEFLRGEVERGRSELKREREKAAAVANGTANGRELDQKDDEIRGLKAIIESMSTGTTNSDTFSGEVKRLKASLEESQKENQRLEKEVEQMRRDGASLNTNGINHNRNSSELTTTAAGPSSRNRSRAGTLRASYNDHAHQNGFAGSSTPPAGDLPPLPGNTNEHTAGAKSSSAGTNGVTGDVYCEMCSSRAHDTLDCTQFQTGYDTSGSAETPNRSAMLSQHSDEVLSGSRKPAPLSLANKENVGQTSSTSTTPTAPATTTSDKWCALCEKEGHLAYECTDEQY